MEEGSGHTVTEARRRCTGFCRPADAYDAFMESVPTNLITGFLGVGKTTAVIDLLKHKAPGSRWAVLVNEYGDVTATRQRR